MTQPLTVLTGATSGIGRAAALQLAAKGHRLVCVARDPARGEALLRDLRAAGHQDAAFHACDLSSVKQTRALARTLAAEHPRIDRLVNNAGALFGRRRLTAEGLERTFALNHCGYVVLTEDLLPSLRAAPEARVVSVASEAHRRAKLDLDNLNGERGYGGWKAYGASKLMNILFTRALHKRLRGSSVSAACLHPGFVASRFGDDSGGPLRLALGVAKRAFAITPEQSATRIVYLADTAAADALAGRYFVNNRPKEPNAQARDDDLAERLWRATEAIVAKATAQEPAHA